MATNPGLSPRKGLLRVTPSPPESPDQLHGNWPGGGRLTGGAAGAAARCCGGGGGGGGGFAACTGGGGGGGLGSSTGLHCATLSLREVSSAASSALSLFSSACASSSEAFRTGVGSGGASGAGGAGVSIVARFRVGSTGEQARNSHDVMSSRRRSKSPNSKALSHGAQPMRAGRRAGALANIAAGRGGNGTGGGAKACRLAAASAS